MRPGATSIRPSVYIAGTLPGAPTVYFHSPSGLHRLPAGYCLLPEDPPGSCYGRKAVRFSVDHTADKSALAYGNFNEELPDILSGYQLPCGTLITRVVQRDAVSE